jgi:hypothetical protein
VDPIILRGAGITSGGMLVEVFILIGVMSSSFFSLEFGSEFFAIWV